MNLLIDMGNSRIKWAVWESGLQAGGSEPLAPAPFSGRLAAAWAGLETPAGIYVANVAGEAAAVDVADCCRRCWNLQPVFMRTEREARGLVNAYGQPEQLGVDRWLAMLAGWSQYRDNLCIAVCGTAVTVDIITADGRHAGGYIFPGAWLMQESLIGGTAGIRTEPGPASGAQPGRSTGECLRNGTHLAVAAFLDRIMADCRSRHGADFLCLLSGGGAEDAAGLVTASCRLEPDLVLRGLAVAAGVSR